MKVNKREMDPKKLKDVRHLFEGFQVYPSINLLKIFLLNILFCDLGIVSKVRYTRSLYLKEG
jgi:hypothetical protein